MEYKRDFKMAAARALFLELSQNNNSNQEYNTCSFFYSTKNKAL